MSVATVTEGEVRERLAGAIKAYGPGTQIAWAKAHGFTPPYVNEVLRGRRSPNAAILAALGLKPVPPAIEVAR